MRLAKKLAALVILSAAWLAAQPVGDAPGGDPPGRVARLNYISGAVSFQPGGVDEWTSAAINRPFTTGDHLWVDQGGAAELHVGSTAIGLAEVTDFSFLDLDDRMVQIRLTQGALNIRVNRLDPEDSYEIDTPNGAFVLLRTGDYRFDVAPDGNSTWATARGGEIEVTAGGQAFTVHPRQSAQVTGTDQPQYSISNAPPQDAWDQWCAERDRREMESQSARYISREVTGYEDLDAHGTWRDEPDYGPVWIPADVPVGWAPYRYGHWVWVSPWGWTWVDDEPWGFAPFHYGRWVFYRGEWAWVPGPIGPRVVVRPVYAPALVAFIGGRNFSVAIGVGGGAGVAAWFPLGPREPYIPAYRVSPAYVNRVNVVNVTNVTNVTNITNVRNVTYVNQNVPGAVTAVSHENFVNARPIGRSAIAVTPRDLSGAQVVGGAPPVAPRQESVLGHSAGIDAGRPPAAAMSRSVMAKTTPPAPPVSFAQHQQALAAHPGRPLDAGELSNIRGGAGPGIHPLIRQASRPGLSMPVANASAGGGVQTERPYRRNVEQPAGRTQVGGDQVQFGGQRPQFQGVPPQQQQGLHPQNAAGIGVPAVQHPQGGPPPQGNINAGPTLHHQAGPTQGGAIQGAQIHENQAQGNPANGERREQRREDRKAERESREKGRREDNK